MYWLNGFYDTPIDGGVEISEEYWHELLDGQSRGLEIVTDDSGRPVLQKHRTTIEEARAAKADRITAYDSSEAVNRFTIDGVSLWLDKQARVSMAAMLDAEQAAGTTSVTLWSNGMPPVAKSLPIVTLRTLLSQLEIYAKATYDVTQQHRAALYTLQTVTEIEAYDHTVGYPPILAFTNI